MVGLTLDKKFIQYQNNTGHMVGRYNHLKKKVTRIIIRLGITQGDATYFLGKYLRPWEIEIEIYADKAVITIYENTYIVSPIHIITKLWYYITLTLH